MRMLVLCLLLLSELAMGEYRAFELIIASADGQDVRQVVSNLDPEQYPTYYPLEPGYRVSYTNTWMCKGRTNAKPPCPNPRAPAAEADPSPAAP